MAGEPVGNNKVIIPRGEVVTDLKNQRWIVGASLGADGSRDIYAVARCDTKEPENYSAVMIFKPHGSDPQTIEMQAHVCNPKTIEKWKKSKGIRHLAVTPILGVASYKYNDEIHPFIITQRYAKNLQQLLANNDKGFIAPTVYRVIGQMFYALEYIHSLGYYIKFDISSDKLLQSFTNPNDIYLDVINYVKTQECLTYRSGKFPVESPYGNLESILYNAFSWLKLPLPWQNDLTDENLVNKQKMKAFAHVDKFLRCVFGNFGVLNPIRHIMMELTSSDVAKEPDYKKFLSIIAEGARNIKNVQYNLDSSLNFDEQLKLRQINKLSRQPIPSFSEDSSDEKDSKVFKKMLDAKGNAENSTKAAVPGAENNTSNAAANNSNATARNSSPILSLGKRNARTAQNVTTPSAATTSTARVEPSKVTEPPKTTVNEVTQDGKPKESESQNEQQRTIPKSVSEVGASTSSNVQPEKNVATSDSIGSCKCKAGAVNDRVNDDSSRRPNNTVQSPDGSESHLKRNLEDESHKKENKISNCNVKTEVIDVSSGDEVSKSGKPNLKVEKPEKKVKNESEKNKDAEKEKRRKSRNKSTDSEDSDSTSKEKSLKKKKSLLKKKKKEKDSNDSGSSDSDDNSSDSKDDGKSKSKKKKRKKHRSASSDSGDTASNSEVKKVKRKKSKKTTRDSDSDVSPTRDSNKKESKSKRITKSRQDRDSDMNSSRDSVRIDPRSRTSFKRRQYSDSDLNSPRHSSRRDSRSRTSPKRRKDSDHDLSPRRSGENKNESSSRNRKRSPNKYSERFSRPRDNSYSTKSYNNSGFSDSRYHSDSGSFRQKVFHNFKNSAHDQSSSSYGQVSKNTNLRFHNNNYGQHYDQPRSSSYQQRYVRGNNHYVRSRPPYIRGGFSQRRDDRMFLNHHETQPGQRWNFLPRSDGRSTSPASTASSNLTEQKQTHNGNYSHEEAQLRSVNQEENGSGQVSAAHDYRRRDFKHNPAVNRERHNERDGIEKLNRAEGRDDLIKKGLPPEVNKPAARDTDDDFELELRTVEQEDPVLSYAREDEVNEDQREPD